MRRLCLLFCLALVAGCRNNLESQLVGTWRVDPTSVQSSRLVPGADKKPDWADTTSVLAKVEVKFRNRPNAVEATGFDQVSSANWQLKGYTIEIQDTKNTWPEMVLDPRGPRIHTTLRKGSDSLTMDLIKVQ